MGSTELLLVTGIEVLLGTAELRVRMVVGSGPEGVETVELTSKGGERLVRSDSIAVGEGTREASGIDVVFFLEVMAD